MTNIIDLRSDTVTKPSQDMRRFMLEAEVGDDVYGEDPTVNALQTKVAELLGKEAALFVPSGCMADQIALGILTSPGDAVMTAPNSHIAFHEAGASPKLNGVQFSFLPSGRFCADDVKKAYLENDHHSPPTTLLEVENTYNMGGGLVWSLPQLREVTETARSLGMKTMLDGARLWNAAVATSVSERDLAKDFDVVTVCLSKGLGAPVGSVLAGSAELMQKAHRLRKMFGGGMRQAGILAAAGLYALAHNRERLAVDHANAQALGDGLNAIRGLALATDSVETNIVLVDVDPSIGTAAELVKRCAHKGLLFAATETQKVRLVTHMDVSGTGCQRALTILRDCCNP